MIATDLLTPESAAPMLGKSVFTVAKYCCEGMLNAAKIGRTWYIQPAEIERAKREGTLPKKGPKPRRKSHAR